MIILLHRFKNNICMFFFPVKFNILNTFFERLGGRGGGEAKKTIN
jgi:hypothetical protein